MKRALFVSILLTACSADVAANPSASRPTIEQSLYIYKTTFSWLPMYDEIRLDKANHRFVAFRHYGQGDSVRVSEIGGTYREEVKEGIAAEMQTGISIPLQLEDGKKWTYKDYQCDASEKSGLFYILCFRNTPRLTISSEVNLYTYSTERGILAFSSQCAVNTKCWFELKSEKGILSELPR